MRDPTFSHFIQCRLVTDRPTDRRTDSDTRRQHILC